MCVCRRTGVSFFIVISFRFVIPATSAVWRYHKEGPVELHRQGYIPGKLLKIMFPSSDVKRLASEELCTNKISTRLPA